MAFNQTLFYNPIIPFTGAIQGGVQVGKTIAISGRVLPGAKRFNVNLQCGSRTNADIAFHFNPRYDGDSCVVANTLQHGNWGNEERKSNSLLLPGSTFNLLITVTYDSFLVNINGCHFMDYRHRIPFNQVDTISVGGTVEISSIACQNNMPAFPTYPAYPPQPVFPTSPAYLPLLGFPPQPGFPTYAVPYRTSINGGFRPGRSITIQGNIPSHATRFHVNLNVNGGIALHYNPRFNEHAVVRNTKQGVHWSGEERGGGMPFHLGQPFTLTISCENSCFRILVNGIQAHTYNHRITPLRNIHTLEIDGDVTLTSVMV
ncbi:galectin-9-like isoform X3 [Solea solea]|uniref:galectin-9-like isoform X3 n=1 Tax=Solea solea TaxID=90069 RepID=UPI00272B75DB|nr:galectin-9-like isoform X3 [Solea solea]